MHKFTGPFHQSDIYKYLTCPFSFYLHKILNIPESYRHPNTVTGSALHWAIDSWHSQQQSPLTHLQAHDFFQDFWHKTLQGLDPMTLAHNSAPLPQIKWEAIDQQQNDLIDDAVSVFFNYTNQEHNLSARVLHSEITFGLVFYNNQFEGTMDQIRINDSGNLELWDFKFSKVAPSQVYLDRSFQFSLYAIAMKEGALYVPGQDALELIQIGEYPEKIVWYHLRNLIPYKRSYKGFQPGDLRGDPRIHTTRSETQLKNTKKDLRKICTMMKSGHFPRSGRDTGGCNGFCRHLDACMNHLENLPLDYQRQAAVADLADLF